jgi:hypothetical protein
MIGVHFGVESGTTTPLFPVIIIDGSCHHTVTVEEAFSRFRDRRLFVKARARGTIQVRARARAHVHVHARAYVRVLYARNPAWGSIAAQWCYQ